MPSGPFALSLFTFSEEAAATAETLLETPSTSVVTQSERPLESRVIEQISREKVPRYELHPSAKSEEQQQQQ